MNCIIYCIGVIVFICLSPLWLKKDDVTIKDCFSEILVTALLWPLFVVVAIIAGAVIVFLILIALIYKIGEYCLNKLSKFFKHGAS